MRCKAIEEPPDPGTGTDTPPTLLPGNGSCGCAALRGRGSPQGGEAAQGAANPAEGCLGVCGRGVGHPRPRKQRVWAAGRQPRQWLFPAAGSGLAADNLLIRWLNYVFFFPPQNINNNHYSNEIIMKSVSFVLATAWEKKK